MSMYTPFFRLQECETLLSQYSLVPIAKQFSLNFDTSLTVFLKTGADYLLESAESGDMMGRFSFIGKGMRRKFVLHRDSIEDWTMDSNGQSMGNTVRNLSNPLEYVKTAMQKYKPPQDELFRFPPFWGGVIGYLGYESVGYFEHIDQLYDKPRIEVPDGILVIPQQLLIVDHLKRLLWIVEAISNVSEYDKACSSIDESWGQINNALPEYALKYNEYSNISNIDNDNSHIAWESSLSKEVFIKKIEYCKECIRRGDVIQVVFSRQLKAKFDSTHELLLYMRLRNINPSPYMYYLRFENFSIVGSSPEIMVSLSLDRTMQVRPIAGTIRRGITRAEDVENQKELINDEKERAEHIMLIDLGRNDLHKISKPGTVYVSKGMYLEGYSHVYHIVSTIEGKIRDELDAFDLIKATFPAGTLSGAPKIEAMNIIGRTETLSRNIYAGMIMVLGFNGYLDSCITIRTAVLKDNTIFLHAGAGIVADSIPEKEWKETELKLGALVHAVEIVQKQKDTIFQESRNSDLGTQP